MSRVEINAAGRHITVDNGTTGDLDAAQQTAHTLWQQTDTKPGPAGPALGFQAERRHVDDIDPLGRGRYSNPPTPVTAQDSAANPYGRE